jgi:hypothetical protein
MAQWFASGRIVDLILGVALLEALLVMALWRGKRWPLISNLLAGLCLMLALRGALVSAHWTLIAACLAAALPAHLCDLWDRFQSASGNPASGPSARSGAAPKD